MPKSRDFNCSFDVKHVFIAQSISNLQAKTSKINILIFHDFLKKNSSKCYELISISMTFRMAPIKQSNLKIKESVIEFYKLDFKKGHGYTYNQWKREKSKGRKKLTMIL